MSAVPRPSLRVSADLLSTVTSSHIHRGVKDDVSTWMLLPLLVVYVALMIQIHYSGFARKLYFDSPWEELNTGRA